MTDAGELTTSNSSATSVSNVTMSNGSSLTLGGAFEVKSGAALTVANSANVLYDNGVTISVDAGAAMTVGPPRWCTRTPTTASPEGSRSPAAPTATGTAFVKGGGGVTGSILVNPAGHLVATGTDFSWDGLTLAGGSC